MTYLGLGLAIISVLSLVRIYQLRREQPEKHATAPPWLDYGVTGGWTGLVVGLLMLVLGLFLY